MKVSVVISARNEYPSIVHTVHSILEDLGSFLPPSEYELVLVNNCSDESNSRRALNGTSDFLATRGMYHNGILRVMYYPVASNVGARNYGAKHARGEYVFFSDAHMFYAHGTFKRWIETIDESGGIVHPAVAWMGSYPPHKGMQYSWKLGEEAKGTWANYLVGDGNDWFYVPAMGHCSIGMKRSQFLEYGGYIENRCYGGGEMYLDTLWWMAGKTVVTDPRINCYHLSSERGYSYIHDDYIYNVFSSLYSLGADMWLERVYLNYLRKSKKDVLDKMLSDAKRDNEGRRKYVKGISVKSFNDVIRERPWDSLNDKKFGSHNSGFLVFQDSWLPLLKGTPAEEAYKNSEYQEELAKFIDENLAKYVYKRTTAMRPQSQSAPVEPSLS